MNMNMQHKMYAHDQMAGHVKHEHEHELIYERTSARKIAQMKILSFHH